MSLLSGCWFLRVAPLMVVVSTLGAGEAPPGRPRPLTEPRAQQLRAEGIERFQKREYFQSLRAFEAALELAGGERTGDLPILVARARSALGVELLNSGEIRQARQLFEEALDSAEDAYARFGLGFVHYVKLENEQAREQIGAALLLEPSHGKSHKLLALLDYRAGRMPEAIEAIQKASDLDPDDREAKTLLERWRAEQRSTRLFREWSRGRFLLRVDPSIPATRVEDTARRLEATGVQIGTAFQTAVSSQIVVVLFSTERFYEATRSFHWVGGLYDGQIKIPLRGGDSPSDTELRELDEALRHEMTHVVVKTLCPECPNWLNEGLAQHFESQALRDTVFADLRRHASNRIRFEDVPLRLWEVDDEELARQAYRQGLGFVEFLVARYHEFRLSLLLSAIHRRGSVRKGFEETYGLGLAEAQAALWDEVLGRTEPDASEKDDPHE